MHKPSVHTHMAENMECYRHRNKWYDNESARSNDGIVLAAMMALCWSESPNYNHACILGNSLRLIQKIPAGTALNPMVSIICKVIVTFFQDLRVLLLAIKEQVAWLEL